VAHLAVAEVCAEAAALDRVLWIPAATPPHKQGDAALASAAHRLAMVRLATSDNARFEVSDIEIARAGVSYTVDTLRALRVERPGDSFRLLVGGDSLAAFGRWREPEAIAEMAPLLVYARPGAEVAAPQATLVEGPPLDLSSTVLRARVAAGRSVRYLVPDAVRAYIEAHGLYR
jgi:nicotinate-nucleotide adenylyltransferase